MTREQKLESMLMTLFTLAPNVKQEHWDEVYEQYKNLDTIAQQSLSGSDDKSSSPKSCRRSGDCSFERVEGKCMGETCGVYDPA